MSRWSNSATLSFSATRTRPSSLNLTVSPTTTGAGPPPSCRGGSRGGTSGPLRSERAGAPTVANGTSCVRDEAVLLLALHSLQHPTLVPFGQRAVHPLRPDLPHRVGDGEPVSLQRC